MHNKSMLWKVEVNKITLRHAMAFVLWIKVTEPVNKTSQRIMGDNVLWVHEESFYENTI